MSSHPRGRAAPEESRNGWDRWNGWLAHAEESHTRTRRHNEILRFTISHNAHFDFALGRNIAHRMHNLPRSVIALNI